MKKVWTILSFDSWLRYFICCLMIDVIDMVDISNAALRVFIMRLPVHDFTLSMISPRLFARAAG